MQDLYIAIKIEATVRKMLQEQKMTLKLLGFMLMIRLFLQSREIKVFKSVACCVKCTCIMNVWPPDPKLSETVAFFTI